MSNKSLVKYQNSGKIGNGSKMVTSEPITYNNYKASTPGPGAYNPNFPSSTTPTPIFHKPQFYPHTIQNH